MKQTGLFQDSFTRTRGKMAVESDWDEQRATE
jgi:hypothetical protein